jgi:hypothetical protein
MLAVTLVIVGGLNWGLVGAVNFDLVKWIGSGLNLPILSNLVYVIVGLAAVYLALNRDVYLPFLNESVFPCSTLKNTVPEAATVKVQVQVTPGAKVVYWASEPNKAQPVTNPWDAYTQYENAGVATADGNGVATLAVRDPATYKIPSGRILSRHVHYRYCVRPGLLSRVETIDI